MKYIKDIQKLKTHIGQFVAYVKERDNTLSVSFIEPGTFLENEENYKSRIFQECKSVLGFADWTSDLIGTGEISKRIISAVDKSSNLIDYRVKSTFYNLLDPLNEKYCPDCEQVLYDIYKSKSNTSAEKDAFEKSINAFGKKYSLIAYLWFLKDKDRFLPISPRQFQNIIFPSIMELL